MIEMKKPPDLLRRFVIFLWIYIYHDQLAWVQEWWWWWCKDV